MDVSPLSIVERPESGDAIRSSSSRGHKSPPAVSFVVMEEKEKPGGRTEILSIGRGVLAGGGSHVRRDPEDLDHFRTVKWLLAPLHFQVLGKLKLPIGPGGVICLVGQALPLTESASSIPVSLL